MLELTLCLGTIMRSSNYDFNRINVRFVILPRRHGTRILDWQTILSQGHP